MMVIIIVMIVFMRVTMLYILHQMLSVRIVCFHC
jgi:hypothetical protein